MAVGTANVRLIGFVIKGFAVVHFGVRAHIRHTVGIVYIVNARFISFVIKSFAVVHFNVRLILHIQLALFRLKHSCSLF